MTGQAPRKYIERALYYLLTHGELEDGKGGKLKPRHIRSTIIEGDSWTNKQVQELAYHHAMYDHKSQDQDECTERSVLRVLEAR